MTTPDAPPLKAQPRGIVSRAPAGALVAKLPPGSWQGPIESGLGWHLVFIDTVVPGRVPPFEEIESDVKVAWLAEQKAKGWENAYREMRAKYTVLLAAPPDGASVSAAPVIRRQGIGTSFGEGGS